MLGYWGNPRGYCCKSSTKTRDKNTKNWIANCENRKCAHTPSALTKRRDKPAKMVATNRYFNIFFCLTIFIRNIFCYVSNAQDIGIGLLLRAQAHVCTTNTVTPHHHHLLVGRAVAIGNNNIAAGARVSCSLYLRWWKLSSTNTNSNFIHSFFITFSFWSLSLKNWIFLLPARNKNK